MRIVRDGALLSLVGSTYLLVLLRFNPRIFLGHYPKEIRKIVPSRSAKERRISLLLGLLIGAALTSALVWRTATLGSHSFWDRFAYAFGVLFIFNLVDLLILDWLIVCWFKLRWAILPGTEHIVIPHPYLHHFKEFLMGTAGLVIAGLAIAALLRNTRKTDPASDAPREGLASSDAVSRRAPAPFALLSMFRGIPHTA